MKKTRNQIRGEIADTVTEYYEECCNRLLQQEVPDAARRERVKKFMRDLVEKAGYDIILADAFTWIMEIAESCDTNSPFEQRARQAATIVEASAEFAVKLAIAGEQFPEQFIVTMKEGK